MGIFFKGRGGVGMSFLKTMEDYLVSVQKGSFFVL